MSDKGTQFYNSKKNRKGKRTLGLFKQELEELGIEFWTSRRNHPQTNGKMEKWFDTMKKRFKKHPKETLKEFVKWYNKKEYTTLSTIKHQKRYTKKKCELITVL